MSLFELQAWLGHSSPHSTQHYARITPVTLTKAYQDAGYFARNVRTIEVLRDRNALTDRTAAVENDQDAVNRLLDRLIDTPTPAGPTPRDLDAADPGPIARDREHRNGRGHAIR